MPEVFYFISSQCMYLYVLSPFLFLNGIRLYTLYVQILGGHKNTTNCKRTSLVEFVMLYLWAHFYPDYSEHSGWCNSVECVTYTDSRLESVGRESGHILKKETAEPHNLSNLCTWCVIKFSLPLGWMT